MFDLANQSFTLLVVTMFFSVYTQQVVAATPQEGDRLWGAMFSGSMLAVVALSPFVGAIADARAWKKELLIGTGLLCAALTCLLGLVSPGAALLAVLLFVPANICFNLGENLLASFLPEISSRETMGRVSATGWSMGYLGALLLLLVSAGAIVAFGWSDPSQWRPLFAFSGLWFLAAMVPTVLFLRERRPARPGVGVVQAAREAVSRVRTTLRHASRFRELAKFFASFFVYSAGTYTVIAFASIITKDTFGFGTVKLVIFILQLTVSAGVASVATGFVQDRLGHRRTVFAFLAIWVVSTGGLATMALMTPPPEWLFWVLANGVGFGLGGIGTASRTLVACFTPRHRTAEFFGLYGMVYKLSGVAGPFVFGFIKAQLGDAAALYVLAGFFFVGAALLMSVSERAGMAQADAAEEDEMPGADDNEPPPPLGAVPSPGPGNIA